MAKTRAPKTPSKSEPSKSTPVKRKPDKPKKKVKYLTYRVGRKAYNLSQKLMQEIEMLQHSTKTLIAKLPFSKLCREITQEFARRRQIMCFESKALEALQEAAEVYLTNLFGDSNILAQHAKRLTLKPIDMQIALFIRGVGDPGRRN